MLDDMDDLDDPIANSEDVADESAEVSVEEDSEGASNPLDLPEEITISGKIEAIIFASPKPLRAIEIHELLADQGYNLKEVQDACDQLVEFYRDRAGGFHLKYVKRMGYQFQTTSAAASLMEKQFSSRPRPLSKAALETLAVIAYRQKQSKGVTRAEVEFIRGVDAGSIFKTLVERNLLTCTGRKEIPGRPMMFGVTDEFLKTFQLGSINDLPPLESFQTPSDVLETANKKIQEFEAEQEGVNPDEYLNDTDYREGVEGPEHYNPLDTAPKIDTPDLIDILQEGQVAWAIPAASPGAERRTLQGATAHSEPDHNIELQTEEVPEHDGNETSEVAVPAGDRQPPGSGDLDQ